MNVQPIDAATYERERALCDKAAAYAEQFRQRNGWIVIPADAAAHPDYAAAGNDMRGRVEQFELLRDLPDSFCAYASEGQVSVWTGLPLGRLEWRSSRPNSGYVSSRYYYGRAWVGGREYSVQGNGDGMMCRMKAIKGRNRAA